MAKPKVTKKSGRKSIKTFKEPSTGKGSKRSKGTGPRVSIKKK